MARLRITYRDQSKTADEVTLGAFAQIASKRRFGIEVLKTDDPEPVLFGAFVELVGPAAAKPEEAFDEWLFGVEGYELVKTDEDDDPANPPLAESSGTSPGSPPTSE